MPGDDDALVAAARDGDRDALDQLLRRHYDRVHAVCRRIAGADRDADDAAQEAMLGIVRGLSRFDGRSAFSTWVYRIATNAALDELRRRRRRPSPHVVGDDDLAPDVGRPARRAPRRGRRGCGSRSTTPSTTCRRSSAPAVVLRDVADLDYAEIAEVLSIPLGTVKSRIARGRAQLADALGNHDAPSQRPTTQRSTPDATTAMNDDQRLLANAYLDGEVTDEERARAEADPEVMAEVARIAVVRTRRSGSPNRRTRPAARRPSPPPSTPSRSARRRRSPPPPSSRSPRRCRSTARRRARWLGPLAAAAAAVVVVAGGVACCATATTMPGMAAATRRPRRRSSPSRRRRWRRHPRTRAAPSWTPPTRQPTRPQRRPRRRRRPRRPRRRDRKAGSRGPDEAVGTDRVLTSPEDLADFAVDADDRDGPRPCSPTASCAARSASRSAWPCTSATARPSPSRSSSTPARRSPPTPRPARSSPAPSSPDAEPGRGRN